MARKSPDSLQNKTCYMLESITEDNVIAVACTHLIKFMSYKNLNLKVNTIIAGVPK